MQTAADGGDGGGGGAQAGAAGWPAPSSSVAPPQLGMDAVRWDGAGEGLGGDGGAAQGGAATAADGDVAADDEAPSRFRKPRLPRAQRAMLGRRMMALTKAIIG